MESRKLLSIVSFTGLPQNGFLPPPFKAPSFHHLKSSLLCPVRDALSLLHPPANTEYQAKFQELRLEE